MKIIVFSLLLVLFSLASISATTPDSEEADMAVLNNLSDLSQRLAEETRKYDKNRDNFVSDEEIDAITAQEAKIQIRQKDSMRSKTEYHAFKRG